MNNSLLSRLAIKNRSYRRFYQEFTIERDSLLQFVELARLSPSAANLQPLRYFLSNDAITNEKIFQQLRWAGYLKEWDGPSPGERPSAYIVIMADTNIGIPGCDHGFAAQSILLGAVEKNLGGCIVANIQKETLKEQLNISDKLDVLLVVALGKPKEEVVLEPMDKSGSVKYWRSENEIHHVPKRSLEEIILN
ncbi:MAG: nitroreductase family protein [Leptospirales bacterium]